MNTDEFEKTLDELLSNFAGVGYSTIDECFDKLRSLHRAALEDAERYRYIRNDLTNASVIAWTQGWDPHIERGHLLDKSIDAARSKP